MQKKNIDREIMAQYVLGNLTDDEKSQIEERYFQESGLFEQILDIEDELMHRYLSNTLERTQRQLFEKNVLSRPEKRKKLKFIQSLVSHAQKQEQEAQEPVAAGAVADKEAGEQAALANEPVQKAASKPGQARGTFLQLLADFLTPNSPALRLAPVFAMLVLAVVSVKFYLDNKGLQTYLDRQLADYAISQQREQELQLQVERQHNQNTELAEQLQNERSLSDDLQEQLQAQSASKNELFATSLFPGTLRSGQTGTLRQTRIERDRQAVQLKLYLEGEIAFAGYHIFLETIAGDDTLWSQQQPFAAQRDENGTFVLFLIPATVFTTADYIISVQGTTAQGELQDAGSYMFRVRKE